MSFFTFSQSSGQFCNEKPGETDQTKKNLGPIPQGSYTIENSCDQAKQKCNLTPDTSNNMFGLKIEQN